MFRLLGRLSVGLGLGVGAVILESFQGVTHEKSPPPGSLLSKWASAQDRAALKAAPKGAKPPRPVYTDSFSVAVPPATTVLALARAFYGSPAFVPERLFFWLRNFGPFLPGGNGLGPVIPPSQVSVSASPTVDGIVGLASSARLWPASCDFAAAESVVGPFVVAERTPTEVLLAWTMGDLRGVTYLGVAPGESLGTKVARCGSAIVYPPGWETGGVRAAAAPAMHRAYSAVLLKWASRWL